MRRVALGLAVVLVLAACGEGATDGQLAVPSTESGAAPVSTGPSATLSPSLVSAPDGEVSIPACDDVPRVSASEDAYADAPIYVANEMPIEEVRAWANRHPGFEAIWVDRDYNGWITVAFSQDAEARQSDLAQEFPGVGVVAVAVEWKVADLHALQSRITSDLGTFLDSFATGTSESKGVVGIHVGVLTDDIRSEVEARFGQQPICLDGRDPSTVPAPGPQPIAGDGWRLLVDQPHVGQPYRTGIATDPASLQALWATIGLDEPPPGFDFETEIVIWFGAVFSGSCPDIRLDDVVIDETTTTATVHAVIVLPNPPAACRADANPRAYIVAVERSKLPVGPFAIQLDADGPPQGVPEERTVVDTDLSQPGAVATPDQIGPDPNLPEPYVIESGDVIEPGYPAPFNLYVHCGIEWLGELNDVNWRTTDPMPAEWKTSVTDTETIEVSLLLMTEPEPLIEVTASSVTVTYKPTIDPIPSCD